MHETFWQIAFGIFLGGLVLAAGHAIITTARRRAGREDSPTWLSGLRWLVNLALVAGFAALSAFIVTRWVESGYPPFSNMPESLTWMAWGLCLVYFVSRGFVHFPGLEAAACLGVAAILAATSLFDMAPRALMPALRSKWLVFHVLTCMVAYGAFFAAFLLALLWLLIWRKREAGSVVDALSYQTMAFGFLLLTVGIVSGAIWARQAWGRYWGWDPKETWSLITWFVYGIYLHYRLVKGGKGAAAERLPMLNSIFAILGFGATLFTYFGVNFLLPSLHSYAG
ncbi:MAG: c-type cytochrome biogenesis protein CcsB [Planctomycetes bacterium]|nr:c-type cytochrome biogenesis protein CcsB [Planctomycetota bacterium]